MRLIKALIFGLTLAAAGASFAGEDSTDKLHCSGQSMWDAGYSSLSPAASDCGAISPSY